MYFHLVIGPQNCRYHSLEEIVLAAIQGGVTHVQLRDKQATSRELLAMGHRLLALVHSKNRTLIINDRVDIALAINADGVHLGQNDLPYPIARKLLGPDKIIGLTIESMEQLQQANDWQPNYIGVGPIFETQTKPDAPSAIGVKQLAKLTRVSRHPVIAIGGINLSNAESVLEAKVNGLAVVSAVAHAQDAQQASHQLKAMIDMKGLCWS